jgi:hypothetical protein
MTFTPDISIQSGLEKVRRQYRHRPREAESISAQLASTPEMMDQVFRIRHDSYVSKGFLDPIPGGLFKDQWDELPNSESYIVYWNNVPAGSVRVSYVDISGQSIGYQESVGMEVFGSEVRELLNEFRTNDKPGKAVEVSRITRHPDFESQDNEVIFALYRIGLYMAMHYDAAMIISTIRQHHMSFYRRLGFIKITDPRPYPRIKFQLGLMVCLKDCFGPVGEAMPFLSGINPKDHICQGLWNGERVKIMQTMEPG